MSPIRKTVIFLVGGVLLVLGVILIPLPGPGLLVVLGGLAILSLEFEWARRWSQKIKDKLPWNRKDQYSQIGRGRRYEDL